MNQVNSHYAMMTGLDRAVFYVPANTI